MTLKLETKCVDIMCPQTTPWGRPTPSNGWLKVQNSYHWPQNGKQVQCSVCTAKKQTRK